MGMATRFSIEKQARREPRSEQMAVQQFTEGNKENEDFVTFCPTWQGS